MKALIVGDLHVADRHNSRRDDYLASFMVKMEQILQLAIKNEVKEIHQLGDVFHFKAPTKTSHKLMKTLNAYFRRCIQDHGILWRFIKGNHDEKDGNPDLIGQPFDLLMSFEGVERFGTLPVEVGHIKVFGLDFSPERNSVEGLEKGIVDGEAVYLTHQNIFPPDTAWFPNIIDLAVLNKQFKGIVNGHIHEGMGLWFQGQGQKWTKQSISPGTEHLLTPNTRFYLNPGSIMRGSIDEHYSKRDVGVYLLDTAAHLNGKPTIGFTFLPITVQPSEEIFKIREHLNKRARSDEFTLFKNAVMSASAEERNLKESLYAFCKGAGTHSTVADEANRYLEETLQES